MTEDRDPTLVRALVGLRRDVETLRWAGPDAARARGRQRRRRTVATASLAVVLVLGLGALSATAVFGHRSAGPGPGGVAALPLSPGPTRSAPVATTTPAPTSAPPPAPTNSPPGTDVPTPADLNPAAVLQPGDVGPGWRIESEQVRGDWPLAFACRPDPASSQLAQVPILAYHARTLTNQSALTLAVSASQVAPGAGPTAMLAHRSRLQSCQASGYASLSIVDTPTVGDESLFVKLGATGDFAVLVRRGDVIADIEQIPDLAQARTLAQRAAARACVVAAC